MSNYIRYFGYFVWLFFLYLLAQNGKQYLTKKDKVFNKTVTRYNWLFVFLLIIPLVFLATTRGKYFADTYNYWNEFESMPMTFSELPEYFSTLTKDRLFYYFSALLKCIIKNRPVIYLFVIAFVQLFLLAFFLRKYSADLLISLFIFVASTDYLSFMYNGMRQFVAVTIILACSKWIFEKKYILAILGVLFASQFHQSALLMVPIIFIVQGKPWNKSTVMILIASFVAIFYVNQFTSILENLLEDTNYTNVVSDWQEWGDDGTNPIRVLVYCIPAIISQIGIRQIREKDDTIINICINMSIVTAGIYIIAMATSGIFVGRLPIYVSIYSNCILLPWEIDHLFNYQSSRVLKFMMIVSFLLFYYYQIHFTWGNI